MTYTSNNKTTNRKHSITKLNSDYKINILIAETTSK